MSRGAMEVRTERIGQGIEVAYGVNEAFNNKILTSARNGELIMWDLNKNGSSKYGKLSP